MNILNELFGIYLIYCCLYFYVSWNTVQRSTLGVLFDLFKFSLVKTIIDIREQMGNLMMGEVTLPISSLTYNIKQDNGKRRPNSIKIIYFLVEILLYHYLSTSNYIKLWFCYSRLLLPAVFPIKWWMLTCSKILIQQFFLYNYSLCTNCYLITFMGRLLNWLK